VLILLLMPAWVPGQWEPPSLHLDRVFKAYHCLDKRARELLKRIRANGVNRQPQIGSYLFQLLTCTQQFPSLISQGFHQTLKFDLCFSDKNLLVTVLWWYFPLCQLFPKSKLMALATLKVCTVYVKHFIL